MVENNKSTEIASSKLGNALDIEGVREDIPIIKWKFCGRNEKHLRLFPPPTATTTPTHMCTAIPTRAHIHADTYTISIHTHSGTHVCIRHTHTSIDTPNCIHLFTRTFLCTRTHTHVYKRLYRISFSHS